MKTVEGKLRSLEQQLVMKDATIAELQIRMLTMEQTSYDGTFLWKITDFSRRREDAVSGRTPSIYSPPFYTSKTGELHFNSLIAFRNQRFYFFKFYLLLV